VKVAVFDSKRKENVSMRTLLVSFIALFVVSGGLAGAQSQATAQDRQAILDYQLTLPRSEHLITAMAAMTKHLVSLPDFQDRLAKSMKMTSAERRSALEKDPAAMAILKQNELSPQDYLVGVPALRMALLAAQGLNSPNVIASPSNVAFAKANLAQLKPRMDAADGLTGRR
jgi:hypothetical protein